MRKVYWVQYEKLVKHLCKYLAANRGKLPVELRGDANTLFTLADTIRITLEAYDTTHARGKGAP